MKPTKVPGSWKDHIGSRAYLFNARHFAYIAGKQLRAPDALTALLALAFSQARDAHRVDSSAYGSIRETFQGFAHGLRHRAPLNDKRISRSYRRNFHTFMGPWAISRLPHQFLVALAYRAAGRRAAHSGRKQAWWDARANFYPERASVLDFRDGGEPRAVDV